MVRTSGPIDPMLNNDMIIHIASYTEKSIISRS